MKNRSAARSRYWLIILFLAFVPLACAIPALELPAPPLPTPTPAGPPLVTASQASPDGLQIYFTDPASPHARDYETGPDEILAAAIDRARLSVDVAAYSFNIWSIRDALIHAHQRGVVVRMVMESDNMDGPEVQQLLDAGIPIISDQREGLMHDKFVVIDRQEVWTGSMNFTAGGIYKDNNNLISIRSSQAAEDYIAEFEVMFKHSLFGPEKFVSAPYPEVNLAGTLLEIYFSPENGVAKRIVELINGAQESIQFMAYTFTSDDIAAAIRERAGAGIVVTGILDEGQAKNSQGGEYDAFRQTGLDVLLDGNVRGLMHHKVIIIDHKIVITGSYNFTASAEETNDENVVVIHSPPAAAQFLDEFWRLYNQAKLHEQPVPTPELPTETPQQE